ncbi:MAG: ferrous iron transport protein A [Sulfurimonas sp.]|uniref:FeoA family protein n=1 Tax=Sulfurimonas sp. TaxID=2022749 RepID=UPI0025DA2A9C|nr:FeoA family protein [Sulfurimonas sp.]MCK9491150.1 ferrous iron transport protein A [Sulfurimonas sp.]
MKTLKDCQKNQKVRVLKLHAPKDLKQRFISLGIMKEAIIEMIESAPGKSTIVVKVGKMTLALRGQEAELIEVKAL